MAQPASALFPARTVLAACLLSPLAASSAAADYRLRDVNLRQHADGVLALMSYSAIPDLASSSLSISNAQSGNPSLNMSQLGGGATMSKETPIYLEGAIGYSRYDPVFVASRGEDAREIPLKWNSGTLQGGIGWDFPLSDSGEWVIRPILNISLGTVASDLRIGKWWLDQNTELNTDFLDGGQMTVGGLGGALMLDYEKVSPEHDIDLEFRYSYIHLETIAGSKSMAGRADSSTANVYARWRAPISDWSLLGKPFRYVLEASHSRYFGDQAGVLGFDYLSSVGAGIELDSSAYNIWITRTRLVARYMFGNNVHGYSIGLACSF
ncbi:autotransporter domain-containing protein [Chitinilyticum litopenaei]|uniref:autotransporter domain-containing protein n=1 Tax=Chitinilyticum litopenaei TaxID=1121276 RepID=UPI00068571F3|nr:autotransporter domain-containing protein [Chitinilyticum litopenaei]